MSSILIGQSQWVPGLATNPYQQLQNLIYLLDIAVKKIKAGDPEGLGLLSEMPEDVEFGEMLVTQVGGSAPALINAWNGIVSTLASIGVSAAPATRTVETNGDQRTGVTVTLLGQAPISSPPSSDALFKTIQPIPSPAGDELVYIYSDARNPPPSQSLSVGTGLGSLALLLGGLYFISRRRRK